MSAEKKGTTPHESIEHGKYHVDPRLHCAVISFNSFLTHLTLVNIIPKAYFKMFSALAQGGTMTSMSKHENNPNMFTVQVQSKSKELFTYSHVSLETLHLLEKSNPSVKKVFEAHTSVKKGHHGKFLDMMAVPGAKISDWHVNKTPGHYTAYVSLPNDPSKKAFSNVSEAHMKKFISDFVPGGSFGIESMEAVESDVPASG
jgi:hypothetical protein